MFDESVSESAKVAVVFAQVSDIGARKSNQDALAHACCNDIHCFVVADGAGGHKGGEIASQLVASTVVEEFARTGSASSSSVRAYVQAASEQVAERQQSDEKLEQMSATVSVLLLDAQRHKAVLGHIGDTRIYFFRRGRIQAVTKDHSLVQQFMDAGVTKAGELRAHPQRSILYAAIGVENDIVNDLPQSKIALMDGDAYLMCTDGFWEMLDEDDMEHTLTVSMSVQHWLDQLTALVRQKAALNPSSHDNYTAYAIWVGEPEAITISQK